MKKLLTFSLAAVAAFALQADSMFRSDINCVKEQNELTVKSDNMKFDRQSWIKDKAVHKYTSTAWTGKLGEDWQTVSYTVTPSKSGNININMMGQWAKTADTRGWVLVDNIKINGELVPNGDFKKTWKNKEGKVYPAHFWLNRKAQYIPDGGKDGSAAILVNHDNSGHYTLKNAEAGKAYTIQFTVKAAEAPMD